MKPLELTKEQKEHLLEMTKKLFPEYKDIYLSEDYISFSKIDRWLDSRKFESSPKHIHWFEFCHEYLAEKILGDYNLIFCHKNTLHPIDYLYSEFKKLNL